MFANGISSFAFSKRSVIICVWHTFTERQPKCCACALALSRGSWSASKAPRLTPKISLFSCSYFVLIFFLDLSFTLYRSLSLSIPFINSFIFMFIKNSYLSYLLLFLLIFFPIPSIFILIPSLSKSLQTFFFLLLLFLVIKFSFFFIFSKWIIIFNDCVILYYNYFVYSFSFLSNINIIIIKRFYLFEILKIFIIKGVWASSERV